jgi:dolichol-phosphate mannosyltransferase
MIAAIIPCYRVGDQVLQVIAEIPPVVHRIYCVDDRCPQSSGDIIEAQCSDPRVHVLRHERNEGVGGAVMTGYARALADGAEIIVKIDGDGQMPVEMLDALLQPILAGYADYAKGNRFYFLRDLEGMPRGRLFGNAVLSFITKLSSGYWSVFDPTNGFTAIHRAALSRLRLHTIQRGYFFESDMLHHLYLARAVVTDVPVRARYGSEPSSLTVAGSILPFLRGNLRNFFRRLVYTYYIRDLNVASLELLLSVLLMASGSLWSLWHFWQSVETGIAATAGESLLGVLPIIMGFQMLLAAIHFDTQNLPTRPLQSLGVRKEPGADPPA